MPVTIVVGGQYGSEGKGKVAHALAREMRASVAVRVGGSNSGHTVITDQGKRMVFRHLPTPSILPGVTCMLTAGSYLNIDVLVAEIKASGIEKEQLRIDPFAMIVTASEIADEENASLHSLIGSTGSGTGAAVAKRVLRSSDLTFAKDIPLLAPFIADTSTELRSRLNHGERVILEGTQGFGLSLLHSRHYPYCTSRDTTAAAFVSEAGLSPIDVDDIVLVIRSYPIRVGGNSGPLSNEVNWDTVTKESGGDVALIEHTSVTHCIRRVARFDAEVVKQAIRYNHPTRIVLNHLDYIDSEAGNRQTLTEKTVKFLESVERDICHPINHVGLGAAAFLGRTGNSVSGAIK